MRRSLLLALFTLFALILAACGSPAEPVPNSQTLEAEEAAHAQDADAEADEDSLVAEEPTSVPPTSTPTDVPPSATPTDVPPTPEPTEVVEEASNDQIAQLVGLLGDPAQGETLFNAMYTTNLGEWACSTCHNHESLDRKIGPGLLNIAERGGERVDGEVAERYIWNSIIAPQDYVVEDYADAQQMPGNYRDLLSDDEIYHLIAYLMTLSE